jgi:hypothetical protein
MADKKDRDQNAPGPDTPSRSEASAPPADSPSGPAMPIAGSPLEAVSVSIPTGGYVASDMLPTGFFTNPLDANVGDDGQEIAPSFGEVLKSIGLAVAESQKALDESLVKTAQELSETTIKVVTDVVQVIDEDGRPDPSQTQLVTEEVSLVNFVPPSPHAWNQVAISMDMSVGEISSERGFTFQQKQTSANLGGGWFSAFGWFGGGTSHNAATVDQSNTSESKWATGQVRMAAELGARPSDKLPVGAEIAIGPKISFSQGAVSEVKQTGFLRRVVEVTVEVRKANGDPNPSKPLEVDVTPFAFAFVDHTGPDAALAANTTGARGQIKLRLTRDVPINNALSPQRGTVRVRLGQIRKQFDITL